MGKKGHLCSVSKRLVSAGRVWHQQIWSWNEQFGRVDEFVNPHQSLLFPSISGLVAGVDPAGGAVTPLVLAAWSRVFPQLTVVLFYPSIPLFLVQNRMFQVHAEDLCCVCCIHWELLLLDRNSTQCNLQQLPAKGLLCYPRLRVSPFVLKISVLKACSYTNMYIQSWELIWGGLNNAQKSTAF